MPAPPSDDSPSRQFQKLCDAILQKLKTTPPPAETLDTRQWVEIASENVGDIVSKLYAKPGDDVKPDIPNAPLTKRNTNIVVDWNTSESKRIIEGLKKKVSKIEKLPGLADLNGVRERVLKLKIKEVSKLFAFVYRSKQAYVEAVSDEEY